MFASVVRRQALRLTLYTSRTCQLCVEAKESLDRVQKKIPFELEQVDIYAEGNEAHQIYMFDIPVVHLNGKHLVQHRIDETKLMHQLQEATTALKK
ncbi:thioredoxin-like protein [Syncephalis fuscata]|nr:thioredoxin-like protein [Syncephalis fuscata]